jgi:hypothetical protein
LKTPQSQPALWQLRRDWKAKRRSIEDKVHLGVIHKKKKKKKAMARMMRAETKKEVKWRNRVVACSCLLLIKRLMCVKHQQQQPTSSSLPFPLNTAKQQVTSITVQREGKCF